MTVLTRDEGSAALQLARRALESAVRKERLQVPHMPSVFDEKRGVFVTIKKGGMLRGCIGLPYPIMALRDAIVEAAVSAGMEDPRFPPVWDGELAALQLEVTVLTTPEPLMGPPALRPKMVNVGRHGLIVRGWGTSGLLLPQVPEEYGWNSEEFLAHTCHKAGLPEDCWKSADAEVFTFEGQIFTEDRV